MQLAVECLWGGELPLSLCPGVGNRRPSEEKNGKSGGGGM